MNQTARELINCEDGFLNDKKYLIMDRDTKFCESHRSVLEQSGVEPVLLPPQSPDMNAYLERFMRSLKSECLNKMIFFGQHSLELALKEYVAHYHSERNHQGLDNQLIDPDEEVGSIAGKIECQERLGGMLKYYYRDAA